MASGAISSVLNTTGAIISYPIFIGGLGIETYGLWIVLATFLQLAMLGDLGVSQSLTKLVAEANGKEDSLAIHDYFFASLLILAVSGVVLVAGLLLVVPSTLGIFGLSADNYDKVQALLPCIGFLSVYALVCQVHHALLCGYGRMDLANYIQALGRLFGILLSAVLLLVAQGLTAMIIGIVGSCLATHIALLVALRRHTGFEFSLPRFPSLRRLRKLVSFSGALFAASFLNNSTHPINKLLLCRYCGVASVPIYEMSVRISLQLRSFIEAALKPMLPEVSYTNAASLRFADRIRRLNGRGLRLILVVACPLYIVMLVSLEPILELWLGADISRPMLPVLGMMLLGGFFSLLSVPAYYTLLGMGRVRAIGFAGAILLLSNVSSALLFLIITRTLTPLLLSCGVVLACGITAIYVIYSNHKMMRSIR